MSSSELTPEQEADAQKLAALFREASQEDFLRIARLLVSKEERHLFGQTEFAIRDILLRVGAKAYEAFLAQKKLGWQTWVESLELPLFSGRIPAIFWGNQANSTGKTLVS